MQVRVPLEAKKFFVHNSLACISESDKHWTSTYQSISITGHKKLKKLDNVKTGNLKKKNKDHKKVLKQDKDTGNL